MPLRRGTRVLVRGIGHARVTAIRCGVLYWREEAQPRRGGGVLADEWRRQIRAVLCEHCGGALEDGGAHGLYCPACAAGEEGAP